MRVEDALQADRAAPSGLHKGWREVSRFGGKGLDLMQLSGEAEGKLSRTVMRITKRISASSPPQPVERSAGVPGRDRLA